MKLLKLSEEHYILADKLDINVGDWITDKYFVYQWKDNSSLLGRMKVTHSTQPLCIIHGDNNKETISYGSTGYLPISEVEELLGVVDVDKKAEEFYEFWYDKYGTSEVDTIVRDAVFHGFRGGYNQFLEDNKEKKYTEEDLREVVRLALEDAEASVIWSKEWYPKKLADRIIQSLQPKTEWEVEFVDDKLKLI